MKCLFDVTASLFALISLSPILIVLFLLIRIKLGAPVIFQQLRPGLNGRPFRIYKFRTMTRAVDAEGNLLPDEKRLTSFGQFLRSYSLDELPELLNVIKCEMSLVGPRPLLMEYLPLYSEEQSLRHNLRPGITGWAQINGRNAISWEEKLKFDVWYVNNRTFWLDMLILARTVKKVFVKEGIHQDGHVTMAKFAGNKKIV
ncbi:MAG: sugar transferase [Elusimicrobiales bacterium]|nr:sugar transferase [Elusimicrobiales bacterium]